MARSKLTSLLCTVSSGALLMMTNSPAHCASATPEKPNILFIMTDQQSAEMMSCAGNTYLKTPAMDSIAANGMRFEGAYSPNPVCMPARTAMVTGHFPSAFGFFSNEDTDRAVIPRQVMDNTMAKVMQRAGYRTVFGGKTHWVGELENPETSGFEFITKDYRDQLAAKCAEFLRGKHDEPFFLVASFMNPHDICFVGLDATSRHYGLPLLLAKEAKADRANVQAAIRLAEQAKKDGVYDSLCPPVKKNAGPTRNQSDYTWPYIAPPPADAARHPRDVYKYQNPYLQTQWKDEDWRLHSWIYHRLTEDVDRQIWIVLEALRETGLDKNTIVVFTSDHGEMDGAHGLVQKPFLYDEAARVPFLVSGPSIPRGVDTKNMVSLVDLLPTFCDFGGGKVPEGLPGRSIKALAQGSATSDDNHFVVAETQGGNRRGWMLRTTRYKYCFYNEGKNREVLFDMQTDPGEMNNIAAEPDAKQILHDHRALLQGWMKKTGGPEASEYMRQFLAN